MDILASDNDSSGEEDIKNVNKMVVNKSYAEKFERISRFKELQRAKEILEEDDEDSCSDIEDDEAEGMTTAMEVQIMKTISSIRKKDPSIYDSKKAWFEKPDVDSDSDDDDQEGNAVSNEQSHKKKTFKDVLRDQLLNADDGESEKKSKKSSTFAYNEEQESIRQALLASASKISADFDSGDDSDEDNMLKIKQKSKEDRAELLTTIDEVRTSGHSNADEFLLNYVANQKWKDASLDDAPSQSRSTGKFSRNLNDDDGPSYEEDEEQLDDLDKFESKYNFRFEELLGNKLTADVEDEDGETTGGLTGLQVIGHARNPTNSLRRPDDKRKQQREARNERKEKEKRVKELELRRLKNLKRQELQDRLRKIARVGGVDELEADGDVDEDTHTEKPNKKNKGKNNNVMDIGMLDDDWDPEKHEAQMAAQFGDDYYADGDAGFGNDEEAHTFALEDDIDMTGIEGWDEAEETKGKRHRKNKKKDKKRHSVAQEDNDDANSDDDENMLRLAASGNTGKMSKEQEQNAAQALEELYALDHEDVVGDITCRFKYKSVAKADYGLSSDDILLAEDSELNKFVSLRKFATYREAKSQSSGVHLGNGSYYNDRSTEEDEAKLSKKRKRLRALIKERQTSNDDQGGVKGNEEIVDVHSGIEGENVTSVETEDTQASAGKRKRKRKPKASAAVNYDALTEPKTSTSKVVTEPSAKKSGSSKKTKDNSKEPKSSKSKKDDGKSSHQKRMDLYK